QFLRLQDLGGLRVGVRIGEIEDQHRGIRQQRTGEQLAAAQWLEGAVVNAQVPAVGDQLLEPRFQRLRVPPGLTDGQEFGVELVEAVEQVRGVQLECLVEILKGEGVLAQV